MTNSSPRRLVADDDAHALRLHLDLGHGPDEPEMDEGEFVKYPAKLHARRVAAELALDEGLVYLAGQQDVTHPDSDQPQPFRQRRYFFYMAGANFPGCHLTYDIGPDRLILWVPYVEPRQVLWLGDSPSPARCMRLYDVDEVRYMHQLTPFLLARRAAATPFYLLPASEREAPMVVVAAAAALPPLRLNQALLQPAMDRARVIKTDYELSMLRRAIQLSSEAHAHVASHLLGMSNERQIEAAFQAYCTARGSRTQSYPIIAASGPNASTLHYGANKEALAHRQLVVVDAGCEWDCYASDITRTLPLKGSWGPESGAIHALVEKMQKQAIAAVRPGVIFRDIHLDACSVALDGLLALGILRGPRDQLAAAGTVTAFFPHGLGHHVGLEVHDVAATLPLLLSASLGLDEGKRRLLTPADLVAMTRAVEADEYDARQKLRPNMVITVEPGIYFCRSYLEGYFLNDPAHAGFIDRQLLEKFYPVGGVRIEDCLLVTPDGHENLTTAPKGQALLDLINHGRPHPVAVGVREGGGGGMRRAKKVI